jgi:hypothetical protein
LATEWPRSSALARRRSFRDDSGIEKRGAGSASEDGETRTQTGTPRFSGTPEQLRRFRAVCSAFALPTKPSGRREIRALSGGFDWVLATKQPSVAKTLPGLVRRIAALRYGRPMPRARSPIRELRITTDFDG